MSCDTLQAGIADRVEPVRRLNDIRTSAVCLRVANKCLVVVVVVVVVVVRASTRRNHIKRGRGSFNTKLCPSLDFHNTIVLCP